MANTTTFLALEVPLHLISKTRRTLRDYVSHHPNIRSVQPHVSSSNLKYLLLRTQLPSDITDLSSLLPQEVSSFIQSHHITPTTFTIHRSDDDLTINEALSKLLPAGVEIPSSFETVGHLIHLNLLDSQLPYKYEIGKIFLSKLKSIKTVVNKVNSISNEFRVFELEILAGEDSTVTEVFENDCRFRFDFRKVYWNSRLQVEHSRLVNKIPPNSVVADVFCGVGPFAIPLAKNNCTVHANDLNPDSISALNENIKLNKIGEQIIVSNKDGKLFIKEMLELPTIPLHFVLNLPASSLDFLHVFKDFLPLSELPTIHVYYFSRSENPCNDVINQINEIFEFSVDVVDSLVVRDVAPCKKMVRIDFIPRLKPNSNDASLCPSSKVMRVE
ncbi:hypothetical protein RCL1_002473 [Eukaryota sp. TZLM3-RCL]